MSRYLETNNDGEHIETLADMDQCKHMINEICCNADADCVADYPTETDCLFCPYFTKEDGMLCSIK